MTTKNKMITALNNQLFRLSEGDIVRVQSFVNAIETQKTGKRAQRQARINSFNEGLGEK